FAGLTSAGLHGARLLIDRLRIGAVGWLDGIGDGDRAAGLPLQLPGGDHLVAFLGARDDRRLVAAGQPGGDEGLVGGVLRIAFVVLAAVLHQVGGVAVRIIS